MEEKELKRLYDRIEGLSIETQDQIIADYIRKQLGMERQYNSGIVDAFLKGFEFGMEGR